MVESVLNMLVAGAPIWNSHKIVLSSKEIHLTDKSSHAATTLLFHQSAVVARIWNVREERFEETLWHVKSPPEVIARNCGRVGWKAVNLRGVSIARDEDFEWVVFKMRTRAGVVEVERTKDVSEETEREVISDRWVYCQWSRRMFYMKCIFVSVCSEAVWLYNVFF